MLCYNASPCPALTYNDAYRLTAQQASAAHATFSYDNAGNTLLKWQEGTSPMTFTYDNANRITTMLQGASLTSYSYDATGNQTVENLNGSSTTNTFDNENRLIGVLYASSPPSTYTYSGSEGLRRSANEKGAGVVTTIWDGDDYLMEKS